MQYVYSVIYKSFSEDFTTGRPLFQALRVHKQANKQTPFLCTAYVTKNPVNNWII